MYFRLAYDLLRFRFYLLYWLVVDCFGVAVVVGAFALWVVSVVWTVCGLVVRAGLGGFMVVWLCYNGGWFCCLLLWVVG